MKYTYWCQSCLSQETEVFIYLSNILIPPADHTPLKCSQIIMGEFLRIKLDLMIKYFLLDDVGVVHLQTQSIRDIHK